MEIHSLLVENETLRKENENLKKSLVDCQEHLKKYTAPKRNKKYYESHKEEMKEKVKAYHATQVSAEKKKQYARTAYLNKKAKLNKDIQENSNI